VGSLDQVGAYGVLQCVCRDRRHQAVPMLCCSVLQCVAVCCRVLDDLFRDIRDIYLFDIYRGIHIHLLRAVAQYVYRDSFICVTRLIFMCAMTHSYVCHDSFKCVP